MVRYTVCLMLGVLALIALECRAKSEATQAAPPSSAPSTAAPAQHHGSAPPPNAIAKLVA